MLVLELPDDVLICDLRERLKNWGYCPGGILGPDRRGKELRNRVAAGWCVLKSLSNISKSTHKLSAQEVERQCQFVAEEINWKLVQCPNKCMVPESQDVTLTRERLTLMRRRILLRSLSRQALADYALLMEMLPTVFVSGYDRDEETVFDATKIWYAPNNDISPGLNETARSLILQSFQDRDPEQISIERSAWLKLQSFVQSLRPHLDRMKPFGVALHPPTLLYPYMWEYQRQFLADEMHMGWFDEAKKSFNDKQILIDLRMPIQQSSQTTTKPEAG
ncbi:hypothetical protein EJ08DRAFT_657390 [Tothia fuscella]|uniref:Uncharacterized protein n=1 Tax=Tothia fuscella TaxID=1048955 RepID=A0A9P4NYU7_9PEZI|nr:hypothetical protein EJ08DRAFT_657390 [Tothia fuscella]